MQNEYGRRGITSDAAEVSRSSVSGRLDYMLGKVTEMVDLATAIDARISGNVSKETDNMVKQGFDGINYNLGRLESELSTLYAVLNSIDQAL